MAQDKDYSVFVHELTEILSADGVSTSPEDLLENSRDYGQLATDPILPLAIAYPNR
ncbi:hypothetical protein [Arthrobacter sp. JCM 19049]|nr:hypothetical protein [Arthrobacter sp. JCM 19049]